MTPRMIRDAMLVGEWEELSSRPPEPPPEWKEYRRDRMRVSIRAAWLFLYGKHDIDTIRKRLSKNGMCKSGCTKQRISQYVKKGTKFLVDRAILRPKVGR